MSQNPVADFSAPVIACKQEKISFLNNSTNADSYAWDFCLNDFYTLKSSVDAATISGLSAGNGYKLIQSNGEWFGFVTSLNNNKLFRLEFGDSPSNSPTLFDLGNPGAKLYLPEGIDVVEANGNWYGFVGSLEFSSAAQGIIRLDFGASLQNIPTATNVGNYGFSTRFRDLKIVKQNTDLILLLSNYNGNSLVAVNYRNSFDNLIDASHIFDSGVISGFNLPIGLDIVNKKSNWIGLVASRGNSEIVQLNFGTDILSNPVVEGNYSFSGVNNPYKVKLTQEADAYFAIVSNESIPIKIINFHDLNPANSPSEINHSELPVLLGIESIKNEGLGLITGVGLVDNKFKLIGFEALCDASLSYSELETPTEIFFTAAGIKRVELTARKQNISSIASADISITDSFAPDIAIGTDGNICAGHSILFNVVNSSNDIIDYDWHFGDASTSMLSNPSHNYASAGVYPITLQVTSSSGCTNSVQSQITTYNQPVSNFSLPSANPFCTNQEYTFQNTSSFDAASNPTWEWSLNGNVISTTKDLLTQFSTTAAQQIKLKSSIPGCESESIQNVSTVVQGPMVDFNAVNGCQEAPVNFTNTSSGSITGYTWDFGDGNQSSALNPTNTFMSHGNFDVVLTATNAVGCENSKAKSITIYSKPQTNFSIDLPPFSCTGSASQFNDLTPLLTDSNITNWIWNFGDAANGTSPQKNPTYVYDLAGDYQVSLKTSNNFGCSNTVQKTVTISPAPLVDFTHDASCLNQGTQFYDASDSNVKAWLWSMQNNTYTSKNPIHNFNNAGDQSVTLAVTGNNNCVSQVSKTLSIPNPVNVDFTAQSTCATKPSIFQETTAAGLDPSTAWRWDFGGQQAVGSPVQHVFQNTGNYTVRLYSTRQSGCVYSTAKSINVVSPPVAQFSMSPEAGAAPLPVGFTNTSVGASSFLWKFNDVSNSTSTLFSPSFTYTAFGEYPVDLIVSNTSGCTDTAQKIVQVVIPQINVALTELTLFNNGDGSLRANVTIKNKSNLTIQNPDVYLDLSGNAQVKEKLSASIFPGQSITRTLSTSILPTNLLYVCAEAIVNGDIDQFDNQTCISFVNEPVFIQPYPNPANDIVYLEWVNTNLESLDVIVYNSLGQPVFSKTYTGLSPGLNQVELYVSNLAEGIYFATYTTGNQTSSIRFSIVR
ncbi:MAG: PKD domain-containing protein [Flammeovirgaceae bacterium]|nr:PKD domain-containing protein [Flammeovirgaceae bacterium]